MAKQGQEPEWRPRRQGVPPEWQVTVRRTTKEDGRYLIYYEFAPGPVPSEEEAARVEEAAEAPR